MLPFKSHNKLELKYLQLLAPPEKGPILTFCIEGIHPLDLATYLDHHNHIAIRSGHLCAQPLLKKFGLKAAARASFGLYNTKEDVDQFIGAVRQSGQFFKSEE